MTRRLLVAFSCLGLGLFACGGGNEAAPPPETPAVEEPAPAPEEPKAETPAEPKPETPKEEPAAPKKMAKDIVTAPSTIFMLSLADSDTKNQIDEDCAKKSKDDEKKKADCVTKAQADVANDGLKFQEDDKKVWWLYYFGKAKGKEVIYSKLQFKIAKEDATTLTLTPEGKDTGKKPIKKLPTEIVIETPDEYTLVFNHPDRGKLVFKGKVDTETKTETKVAPDEKPEKK
jgi:hypothetical protein